MIKKPGMGRKKIEIKKIENKRSLEVTFSKRRTGLFKKVGNLCTLCGAEAAVVVFSPAGRPYVFEYPLADSVIQRFIHEDTHSSPSVGHGQRQCPEAPESLQVETEIEEAAVTGNGEDGFWWDAPIENMGLSELERFKASIEELRKKVTVLVEEKTMMMQSVHCNATVEYVTPPQSQLQFQCQPHHQDFSSSLDCVPYGFDRSLVQCQPCDQHSSPLLDGLFALERFKAAVEVCRRKMTVPVEEKMMMMESVPYNATVDGVPYGFVECQPQPYNQNDEALF